MEKLKSVDEFRDKLRIANSRHTVLTVGAGAVVMIIIDSILKISIHNVPLWKLGLFLVLVNIYLVIRYFYRGTYKPAYWALYGYLHIIVAWCFFNIVSLPSPLLAFVVIISMSVFIELGYLGMTCSVMAFDTALILAMLHQGVISTHEQLFMLVAYLLGVGFMTYYTTIFLRLADEELVVLDQSIGQTIFERSRLEVLVNNLNDAVIGCDEEMNVVLTNPKALHILNIDQPPVGRSLDSLMQLKDDAGNAVTFQQLLNPNKKVVIYTNHRLYYSEKDFISLYIAINNVSINAAGGESGYVVLLRDITRQKSLEEERTEFISIMSHELRTPVSIVEGGISMAQSLATNENPKLNRFLEKAHDQTIMLAEIVNSLSTLVHSERDHEKIETVEVDPRVIVEKIAGNYTAEAAEHKLELKTDIAPDLPMVYTSQEYLYEILQNFVTNALKYTKQGSITVSVRENNKTHVAFSVKDTGIGISTADQDHVFDRFWRSEDFRTRESNGTGLGLYITKKLADSLGATLSVDSELDKGTTFTLSVPILGNRDI